MKLFLYCFFLLCIVAMVSSFNGYTNGQTVSSKAALGKKLFSEKILSLDSGISCASCHKPAFAFADTVAFSTGIHNTEGNRNTPSVLNMKNRPYFFWDGRAASLAAQALIPMADHNEMGLPVAEAVRRLNKSVLYKNLFFKIFRQAPNAKNIGAAFAAYEQTLETFNSRFDDWANGDGTLTTAEENGRQLFIGSRAKCFDCHFGEDFTGDEFKNIGLFNGNFLTDSGRYLITKRKEDLGKFKTPGLRNVAVTAPYMHNGMFASLQEVLRYYNNPKGFFPHQINMDSSFNEPPGLTQKEQDDIIAFLKTLTDKAYAK